MVLNFATCVWTVGAFEKGVFMKKKYVSLIFLISPLLLLPLDWYCKMKVNRDTFESLGTSGVEALMDHGLRIGLIFLLTIVIQFLSVKCSVTIYCVLTKVLLCGVLSLYPVTYYGDFGLVKRFIFEFYSIGFYLAMILILFSIILDVTIGEKKVFKEGNDMRNRKKGLQC